MKHKKICVMLIASVTAITLFGCSAKEDVKSSNMSGMNHSMMNHAGSGMVPKGLKKAMNPTYKIGSEVRIKEGHMNGMKGAKATIVGAYDTIAYAVSYEPTNGGQKVTNHKWIIHEEIKDAGEAPLKIGAVVTTMANHMKGMEGAKVVIDAAQKTTVYMINFTPTDGSEKVTNHQWVTESELEAIK